MFPVIPGPVLQMPAVGIPEKTQEIATGTTYPRNDSGSI